MRQLVLLLCIALPISADTLASVKTALGKLNAKSPLRVTWSLEEHDSTKGKFANDASARRISVEASQDADSLRVEIPRALIEKAGEEARASHTDTRRALSSISPIGIAEDIDFADAFSAMLNLGTVAEERRVMWNGAPARLLVLNMKEPKHEHEVSIGKVDYKENRLTVWIGADDLPLAAEHVRKASAGFLIFHGDSTTKKTWQFARRDDHFIVTRYEDWTSFSGLGQQGQGHTIVTVAVH
ncbi:MAG TPA: hypothetical protein VJ901_03300 [Thermoanaerobaculia bacterium]|nr:hypothetical protein [Thermoanaerobaculia bacterium]